MSGQSSRELESRVFVLYMKLIDWLFSDEIRDRFRFSDKGIKLYESSGERDIVSLYDSSLEVLASETKNDGYKLLKIDPASGDSSLEALANTLEAILEYTDPDNFPDDKETREAILLEWARWTLQIRSMRIGLWCQIKFDCSIQELIEKAKNSDTNAFRNLIRLDSVFLTAPWAKALITKSELQDDSTFRKNISQALKRPEGFWSMHAGKKNYRDALALHAMSQIGFEDRPFSIWADFLDEHGYTNLDNEQSVAKSVKRYKIPKKYPKRDMK